MSCFLHFLCFLLEYIVYLHIYVCIHITCIYIYDINISNQLASMEWTLWLVVSDFTVAQVPTRLCHALSILPLLPKHCSCESSFGRNIPRISRVCPPKPLVSAKQFVQFLSYSQLERVENSTLPVCCPFDCSLLSRGPRRSPIQGRSGSLASAWSKRWERPNLVGKGRYKFASLAWFAATHTWWTLVVETQSQTSNEAQV